MSATTFVNSSIFLMLFKVHNIEIALQIYTIKLITKTFSNFFAEKMQKKSHFSPYIDDFARFCHRNEVAIHLFAVDVESLDALLRTVGV